ncbi:MAG: ATP-grasp domain-containing protein [Lachnospiraceae bacterium]|nr:ATP-grasp domain-containing protein [Lachnospiraceae bacterium]
MERTKLVWIGIRESEIEEAKSLFFASITIFGSNANNNYSLDKTVSHRINYGQENEEWNCFATQTAQKLIDTYPDVRFMGYYPMEMIELSSQIKERAVCVNDSTITDILENKLYTKLWISSFVPTIPFSTFIDTELTYENFCKAFKEYKKFVLQGTFSCGGSGTWLIKNNSDLDKFMCHPDEEHVVMVTPYLENSVSVNTHIIIYPNGINCFPASIQIIEHFEHRLCYAGGDFPAAQTLSADILDKIYHYSYEIGKRLSRIGYRGICGIDFLVTGNKVYFMEINARFQSSTFLLNRALKKNHLPTMQEMNMHAYVNEMPTQIPDTFSVSESFLSVNYTMDTLVRAKYLWKRAFKCPEIANVIDDDISWKYDMEFDTYLYKLVFHTNITCLAPDGCLRLYNGFDLTWKLDIDHSWKEQPKHFKTAILNQGVALSDACSAELEKAGGPNHEMFDALDLTIDNTIYMNVPYMVKFSELSPFVIDFNGNDFILNYYDQSIANVKIRTKDFYANNVTTSGIPYSWISYMGVDRLRIHVRSGCYFKDAGIGCKFCGIEGGSVHSLKDIKEVLNTYKDVDQLRHFLVGGGSFAPSDNFHEILETVRYIHETYNKNIYLMSIPPMDPSILYQLKEAGVTEVTFNLEMYNRTHAVQIMPGKGSIPFERYDAAFRIAVDIWGKDGKVRSALIVGLEPPDITLQGVEYLCSVGVAPILSLFKPDGSMEDYLAPGNDEILYIWQTAEKICNRYKMSLGPSCHYCEDNVLKLTMNKYSD